MPGIRGPAGPPGDAGAQGIMLWQFTHFLSLSIGLFI